MTTSDLEFTLLMPCLNERETIETCVRKARASLEKLGLDGEVLVADNGSTDGSPELAIAAGARVVQVKQSGYGSALRGGIQEARGRFVIMGDADDSYDWSELAGFVEALRAGADIAMGCRFPRGGGTILPGAMPPLHRWFGNPGLSWLGRLLFRAPVTDFYCGLRGFRRDRMLALDLRSTGMEYALEQVVRSGLTGYRFAEVPITLHPDGRGRRPHLRTWVDGWRSLRFFLMYSPRWLFLYPGLALMAGGLLLLLVLLSGTIQIGGALFDVDAQLAGSLALLVGGQMVWFALAGRVFAASEGLLPLDDRLHRLFRWITLERGIVLGAAIALCGLYPFVAVLVRRLNAPLASLNELSDIRMVVVGVTLMGLGTQTLFGSFLVSLLGLRRGERVETAPYPVPPAGDVSADA